jgi:hypothetical protein
VFWCFTVSMAVVWYRSLYACPAMTQEERDEMNRLCLLIQNEKDHQRFTDLIAQLNDLLDSKKRRLDDESHQP